MQDQVETLCMFGVIKTHVTLFNFTANASFSRVSFWAIFSWPLGLDVTIVI